MPTSSAARPDTLPSVGARVRFVQDADRYPEGIIPAGWYGTVTMADHGAIYVLPDDPWDNNSTSDHDRWVREFKRNTASEWDSCVQWADVGPDDMDAVEWFWTDCELIEVAPTSDKNAELRDVVRALVDWQETPRPEDHEVDWRGLEAIIHRARSLLGIELPR